MSSQYLNQTVPNQNINIRVNDAIIDKSVLTKDLQINQFLYKKHTILTQATNPTTSVNANYKANLTINTQTFTTPHSNNNSTSFVVNNFECSGNGAVVRVDIQQYLGSGLPIVTGRCDAGNLYEITIINIHKNQDLNSTFRLSLELVEFV